MVDIRLQAAHPFSSGRLSREDRHEESAQPCRRCASWIDMDCALMGTSTSSIVRTGRHPQPRGTQSCRGRSCPRTIKRSIRARALLREARWHDHHADQGVVNPDQRHDHLQRLAAVGIDPTAAQQRGQFELRTNTETYLRDGRFDQDRMLEVFEQLAGSNAKGGFPLSRIICHMEWVAEGRSHVDHLVEFESRVNDGVSVLR